MSHNKAALRLRQCNNVLSVVVLLLGIYILLMPVLPNIEFWWRKTTNAKPPLVASVIEEKASKPAAKAPVPAENTLVIPALNMQQLVHAGTSAAALNKGVWHRPASSNPTKGSNTVLVGHRFTYKNPEGVFYHLDKLKLGDEIVLFWEGKEYRYVVNRIFVVKPSAVEVEAPTEETLLTLYTCTPLWNPKDRLVIQAAPVGGGE